MHFAEKRIPALMTVLAILAALAVGFFVALGVRSVIAGPDAAPSAAPPNPGHSWSQIGDLPGTMWHSNNDGTGSGLDADTVDGAQASALEESAEIDSDIAIHTSDPSAHHAQIAGLAGGSFRLMRRDNNWGMRLTGGSFVFPVWEYWSNNNVGTGVLQIGPFTAGTRIWFQGRAGWQVCEWRLRRLSDDAILFAIGGDNATEYRIRNIDTASYAGTQIYLEVEDFAAGECGWRGPIVIEE